MGTDGHIKVFDLRKLKAKFGAADTNNFVQCVLSNQTYKQTLKVDDIKIPVLTDYWGDNFPYPSSLDSIADSRCARSTYIDFYSNFKDVGITKEYAITIARYLYSNCEMFEWEVST